MTATGKAPDPDSGRVAEEWPVPDLVQDVQKGVGFLS